MFERRISQYLLCSKGFLIEEVLKSYNLPNWAE